MLAFLTDFTQLREVNCYNVAGFKNVQVIQLFSKSLDATNEMGFLFKFQICQMLSGRLCQSFRPMYLKDLVPDCFCCCWDVLIKTRNAHLTVKMIAYNEHADMDLLILE